MNQSHFVTSVNRMFRTLVGTCVIVILGAVVTAVAMATAVMVSIQMAGLVGYVGLDTHITCCVLNAITDTWLKLKKQGHLQHLKQQSCKSNRMSSFLTKFFFLWYSRIWQLT